MHGHHLALVPVEIELLGALEARASAVGEINRHGDLALAAATVLDDGDGAVALAGRRRLDRDDARRRAGAAERAGDRDEDQVPGIHGGRATRKNMSTRTRRAITAMAVIDASGSTRRSAGRPCATRICGPAPSGHSPNSYLVTFLPPERTMTSARMSWPAVVYR